MSDTSGLGRPRFGRINAATKYSSRSRGRLYQLASQHVGLFVKDGKSTLVNFDKLDAILDALPDAGIRPLARLRAKAKAPQPRRKRQQQHAGDA